MYSEKKPPIAPPHFHPNPPRQYRKKDVPKGSFEPPPPLPLKPLRRETEELPKLAMSQEANVHKNVCFEESATYEAVDTAQDYQGELVSLFTGMYACMYESQYIIICVSHR